MAKKIAMIIAKEDFRDEEFFIPQGLFEEASFEVVVFSNQKGVALGNYGGVVQVNFSLEELKSEEFLAVIFVGGSGCLKYLNNQASWQIAKKTLADGNILAGICIASVILAESGVLADKKATVWSNPMDKSAIKILEDRGAVYQEKPVVIDGQIITASGPAFARQFAEAIIRAINGPRG